MNVGIVGAGFTGLAAAYKLVKKGYNVTIFEKEKFPGGLAMGYKEEKWEWSLEKHYHHLFANDDNIISLAKSLDYPLITKRPKTSVYSNGLIYQLDSPIQVLKFPNLTFLERLRMGLILGMLRYDPFWKPLESIRAEDFLSKAMGYNAYNTLWRPLIESKFRSYSKEISLAWFWARISKRTAELVYPEGGFSNFADLLADKIKAWGGTFLYNTEITNLIVEKNNKVTVGYGKNKKMSFDKVVVTLPSQLFMKFSPQLPENYKDKLRLLRGIGSVNLILRLKKNFFQDKTYWLSICDKAPFLVVVEHTNYMDKKYYNNEHIVYVGNYLPVNHSYFSLEPEKLLQVYDPFLQKLHNGYKNELIGLRVFKNSFTQPIIPINYSKILPLFYTPLKNVYLANIQQVYPWDRGTNYAVELGEKIADVITSENSSLL